MKWTVLQIPCPGRRCINSEIIDWTHYKCGGTLFINNKAEIGCGSCSRVSNLFCWGFDCGSHPGSERFLTPTIDTFSAVIAGSTELTDKMGAWWYRKLLKNMLKKSISD